MRRQLYFAARFPDVPRGGARRAATQSAAAALRARHSGVLRTSVSRRDAQCQRGGWLLRPAPRRFTLAAGRWAPINWTPVSTRGKLPAVALPSTVSTYMTARSLFHTRVRAQQRFCARHRRPTTAYRCARPPVHVATSPYVPSPPRETALETCAVDKQLASSKENSNVH